MTLPLDFGKIFTQVARGSRVPESPAGALTFETQTSFTFTLFIVAHPDDVGNRKKIYKKMQLWVPSPAAE